MKQCPRCQRQFACASGGASPSACWCSAKPVLHLTTQAALPPAQRDCYCPQCFDELLVQQQDLDASKAAAT